METQSTDTNPDQPAAEKTVLMTGKKLWRYCWVSALIGLVIGISWGLVLGTVLTVKQLDHPEKTPTFNSPLKTY